MNAHIPWGRVWLTLALIVAVVLATGFTLEYLGVDLFASRF